MAGRAPLGSPVRQANPAHVDLARRVLALESAEGGAGDPAEAACRTFEQLHAHLDPLLGAAGVQALLVRSARLAQDEAFSLEDAMAQGTADLLRERLRAIDPTIAAEASAGLFGVFITLITTFIGERLTTQVLRKAWPTFEVAAPKESEK